MLTEDHPNAVWLRQMYNGGAEIARDATLSTEQVAERLQQHLASMKERMAPDVIVHTGGFRLAATIRGEEVERYSRRRGSLCDANILPLELDQVLADDYYGIIHGTFRSSRNGQVWERTGMGAWRFEDGIAVEHWELSNAPKWDDFFLSGAPALEGTAREFWLQSE